MKKKSKVIEAPYVEPDKSQLGDTHLNPEEAVCRECEELLKIAATRRVWGQDELEDAERSLGPRMSANDLIRRLRKANPDIQVKDGIPGNVALYLRKKAYEYGPEDEDRSGFFIDHKYVGGFPLHPLPEWGHVDTDTSRLATREHRGWRSVLIALIKGGALTYQQACTEFSEPYDKRSWMWHEQLQPFKNAVTN